MKAIIHENAIEKLMEHFNEEQLREISFALNPDSEDIYSTLCNIEENSLIRDYEADDLKERISDIDLLIKDHNVLKTDDFIKELIDQADELKIVIEGLSNE